MCLTSTFSYCLDLVPQIFLSYQTMSPKYGIYVSWHAHRFPLLKINALFSHFLKDFMKSFTAKDYFELPLADLVVKTLSKNIKKVLI